MSRKKPSYEELEAKLAEAQALISSLRSGKIDALIGENETLLIRAKSAEEALKKAAHRWKLIFDSLAEPVMILDKDSRIIDCNLATEKLLSMTRDEILGKKCYEIVHKTSEPIKGCPFVKLCKTGEPTTIEMEVGGRTLIVSVSPVIDDKGGLEGAVHVMTDITELKRSEAARRDLEAQLVHARKMEAIGRLASGVVHDFNNMLMIIMGYAEIGESGLKSPDEQAAVFSEIRDAAVRASQLVRRLMTLASEAPAKPEKIDVCNALQASRKMLARLAGESVEIELETCAKDSAVWMDPSQLDQILVNLTANAVHAMGGAGKIRISVTKADICGFPEHDPGHEKGDYVLLRFEDTGPGIPEDIMENIFEPFFTTKGDSDSMGMGLATVYGIVKQNRGTIKAYNSDKGGAVFEILLPVYEGPEKELPGITEEKAVLPPAKAMIWIIEDDPQVLELLRIFLEKHGFEPVCFTDAGDAVEKARDPDMQVDLVVCDLFLKKTTGGEVTRAIKKYRPDLPVLFISGHSLELVKRQELLGDDLHFLQKPFTAKDLYEKVVQILSTRTIKEAGEKL